MTHIDPFAPADSPSHPANFNSELAMPEYGHGFATTPEVPADVAPRWIAIIGDPIPETEAGADAAEARWKEYETLLRKRGTPEQVEIYDVAPTVDWPEDMPTLVQLRDMPDTEPEQGDEDAGDLEAKLQRDLAALDESAL